MQTLQRPKNEDIITPRCFIENVRKGYSIPINLRAIVGELSALDSQLMSNMVAQYFKKKPYPFGIKPVSPSILKHNAIAFHKKAGTITPSVIQNISRLETNAPRLRIAHQANLFPYLGIVSQFFLLETVAEQLLRQNMPAPCQLFIIDDYDVAGDNRFRVSHIPDTCRQNGSFNLSGVVPKGLFQNPMWTIIKPHKEIVKKWIEQIYFFIQNDLSLLRQVDIKEKNKGFFHQNINDVEKLIWDAYDRADTLVEFNAFFLSKLINIQWEMPIAFIFGHEIQQSMKNAYELLIENWENIDSLTDKAITFFQNQGINIKFNLADRKLKPFPLWITCKGQHGKEKCNNRLALYAQDIKSKVITYCRCDRCGSEYKFDIGRTNDINLDSMIDYGISPRVLMDNFLDVVALGITGGSMYIGSAEHMLLSRYIAIGLNWEIPPHWFWAPRSIFFGLSECLATYFHSNSSASNSQQNRAILALRWSYFGKASILYYLINQGVEGFSIAWRKYLFKSIHLRDNNIAFDNSPLLFNNNIIEHMNALVTQLEE